MVNKARDFGAVKLNEMQKFEEQFRLVMVIAGIFLEDGSEIIYLNKTEKKWLQTHSEQLAKAKTQLTEVGARTFEREKSYVQRKKGIIESGIGIC